MLRIQSLNILVIYYIIVIILLFLILSYHIEKRTQLTQLGLLHHTTSLVRFKDAQSNAAAPGCSGLTPEEHWWSWDSLKTVSSISSKLMPLNLIQTDTDAFRARPSQTKHE